MSADMHALATFHKLCALLRALYCVQSVFLTCELGQALAMPPSAASLVRPAAPLHRRLRLTNVTCVLRVQYGRGVTICLLCYPPHLCSAVQGSGSENTDLAPIPAGPGPDLAPRGATLGGRSPVPGPLLRASVHHPGGGGAHVWGWGGACVWGCGRKRCTAWLSW